MKVSRRQLAKLVNEGKVKPKLDGSLEDHRDAAPSVKTDNLKRSWKVHSVERDWDGYISSFEISEQ
jgi:hypothetical protein